MTATVKWDVERLVDIRLMASTTSAFAAALGSSQTPLYETMTSSDGKYVHTPLDGIGFDLTYCSELMLIAAVFNPDTGQAIYTSYAYWPIDTAIHGAKTRSKPPTLFDAKRDIRDLRTGSFTDDPATIYTLYLGRYRALKANLVQDLQHNVDEQRIATVIAIMDNLYPYSGIATEVAIRFEGFDTDDFKSVSVNIAETILDHAYDAADDAPIISIAFYILHSVERWAKYVVDIERLTCYGILLRLLDVRIVDIAPPTITIFEIRDQKGIKVGKGETVWGTITIQARVTDDQRVKTVSFLVDGSIINELQNTNGDIYKIDYNTVNCGPGTKYIEIMAVDDVGHWHSFDQSIYVDNSIDVTVKLSASDIEINKSFLITGNVKDAGGNLLSGASVSAWVDQTMVGATIAEAGLYSSGATSPTEPGTVSIDVTAVYDGETASESAKLNVFDPKEGHDVGLYGNFFNLPRDHIAPNEAVAIEAYILT